MERMIHHSNNPSTNWVMRQVGGPRAVQRILEQNYPGIFHATSIVEYIPRGRENLPKQGLCPRLQSLSVRPMERQHRRRGGRGYRSRPCQGGACRHEVDGHMVDTSYSSSSMTPSWRSSPAGRGCPGAAPPRCRARDGAGGPGALPGHPGHHRPGDRERLLLRLRPRRAVSRRTI
jgi:hypothetical protein